VSGKAATERNFADELRIRTNPHYDHAREPEENPVDYWNPVSATNDLIKVANATLEITSHVSKDMKDLMTVRTRRKQLERDIEAFERDLLVKEPPATGETKSTKLVAAAIERRATAAGTLPQYLAMLTELAQLAQDEVRLDSRIERGHLWLKTAERLSDNIKTALSFYKDERKHDYAVRA
jgi:hypothetical protein